VLAQFNSYHYSNGYSRNGLQSKFVRIHLWSRDSYQPRSGMGVTSTFSQWLWHHSGSGGNQSCRMCSGGLRTSRQASCEAKLEVTVDEDLLLEDHKAIDAILDRCRAVSSMGQSYLNKGPVGRYRTGPNDEKYKANKAPPSSTFHILSS